MGTPPRFNFLIVYGEGMRVLRLNCPRWIIWGGLSVLVLAASTLGTIFGDYVALKKQFGQVAALRSQVRQQQALIDNFHQRVAEVRGEVASWSALHAKIWEPFGPEARVSKRESGVGGGEPGHPAPATAPAGLAQEVELLSATVQEEGRSLQELARFLAKAGRVLAALPSRWPARGSVNSEFGRRRSPWTNSSEFHHGIDIDAERGTAVKAPAPGRVVFAGPKGDYGRTVILDHGHDVRTLYAHLKTIRVRSGQRVKRGQVIARSGNTGRSSGPHLHYEVHVKRKAVNPRGFLWD